jgi:hypothetical protein
MIDKFKVKVVRVDEHQQGDQGFTVGNVYEAWNETNGVIDCIDDLGMTSALFEGEWERVNVE